MPTEEQSTARKVQNTITWAEEIPELQCRFYRMYRQEAAIPLTAGTVKRTQAAKTINISIGENGTRKIGTMTENPNLKETA